MLPIRTILHPTDFSDRSAYAFRLACALARDTGARLLVLHVALPPLVVYGEGYVPVEPESVRRELEELLHAVRPRSPAVHVEHWLRDGDPAAEILHAADESKCDVIVLGTHGRTGLARLLMGSVAEQVVRQARCPVLTVRLPAARATPHGPVPEEAAEPRQTV
jgi:nucleotide-binding universal stress UspA family protein